MASVSLLVYTVGRCAAAGALASDIWLFRILGRFPQRKSDRRRTFMASKLYVGGLSYSTTGETLREYFSQCGTVESASVITDKFSGQSRGFGFIEMATAEEAQRAIAELNGKELDGRKITVNVSNPRAPGSGGGRGPGGPRGGGRGPGGPRGGGGDRGAYGVPPSKKPFRW